MSATLSTTVQPGVTNRSGTLSRVVVTCWDTITGYVVRRTAIATLNALDDRALRDIGIVRSQIEAAVRGLVSLPGQGRMP
jgi:uncharacterized protein YjiS (DUF1127 family)